MLKIGILIPTAIYGLSWVLVLVCLQHQYSLGAASGRPQNGRPCMMLPFSHAVHLLRHSLVGWALSATLWSSKASRHRWPFGCLLKVHSVTPSLNMRYLCLSRIEYQHIYRGRPGSMFSYPDLAWWPGPPLVGRLAAGLGPMGTVTA